MPIRQIFRRDIKDWTQMQIQQVELYLSLHPFFSKFYEHEDFNKILNIIFYAKIKENQEKRLEFNKKSSIIILLSGQIELYRKITQRQKSKKPKKRKILHQNFICRGTFKKDYDIIELRDDVIVKTVEGSQAEFLYLPTLLYEAHYQQVKKRKSQKIIEALEIRFINAPKRDLRDLAQFAAQFREYRMNSYIYRAGTVPQACYILVKGVVKIESTNFSARKLLDIHFINQNDIFGDKDLQQQQRTQSAICGSSYCKILSIKKQQFNKFMIRNQQLFTNKSQKLKQLLHQRQRSITAIGQYKTKFILPKIRLSSQLKPQQQKKIQTQMFNNCHISINYNLDRKLSHSFRVASPRQDQIFQNQFKKKLRLFKKIRSKSKHIDINFTNKLF